MNSSNDDYDSDDYYDYYDDDKYDEYDAHPQKVKAGNGSKNIPFHSGRGTRAKLANFENALVNAQKRIVDRTKK